MSAILQIGEDEFLLETRAAVLRTTAAQISSTDVCSALSLLEQQPFDIVILCHTVPEHLCQTLSEIILESWPGTRILRVSAIPEWEQCDILRGIDFCPPDPERLIAHAVALLGRRGPHSVKSHDRNALPRVTAAN